MRREDPIVLALADRAIALEQTLDPEGGVMELLAHTHTRAQLEPVRDYFNRRLHRCSFDFDATRGLKLVIHALQHAPWPGSEAVV